MDSGLLLPCHSPPSWSENILTMTRIRHLGPLHISFRKTLTAWSRQRSSVPWAKPPRSPPSTAPRRPPATTPVPSPFNAWRRRLAPAVLHRYSGAVPARRALVPAHAQRRALRERVRRGRFRAPPLPVVLRIADWFAMFRVRFSVDARDAVT